MNGMVAQVKSLPALLTTVFTELDETARKSLHPELILSLKRIFITGCGDSHHASLNSELAFKTLTGLPVEVATAMQFARYSAGFIPQTGPFTNLVIGISVSGEVTRTLEALNMARQAGATTLALSATPGSRVAMAGDVLFQVPNPAFPDPEGVHIPGARSFFINQVALLLIAIRIGEVRGTLTSPQATAIRNEIFALGKVIEETINSNESAIQKLAADWKDAKEFVFEGSGPNFGIALFTAAKVLEASGDPALGQDTEEWCHLQYFAKDANTPTFAITAAERDLSRVTEMVVAAKAIGRRVVVIAPKTALELTKLADAAFTFSPVREMFSHLVTQIPGLLFAAYRAEVVGEPFFRGFGGGRSTEGGGGISRIRTSELSKKWMP
jgi:glucosamine--fructose-6-phosphate aminotransferase (isomerizing)